MKILYHHRTQSKDGQYVHISEMIHALRQLGHEVIVVAPAAMAKRKFGDDAGMVAMLKRLLPRFAYEVMELAYSLIAYRQLAQAVRKFKPDCLYERYNLFLPAGIWLKRRYRLPMLLEVNAPLFDERCTYEGISLKRIAHRLERYTWKGADYVLPVTGVLADQIERAGVPRARIAVIPNGINREHFSRQMSTEEAKRQLGLQGRTVLGFTGFIRDWHGLDRVLELVARPNMNAACHLLIVGDGPARASLERRAAELNVSDRVTITGVIERERVPAHVAAFDIALQPAVVPYASPLKLFEYMAMGRAIVAPAERNIAEILNDVDNAVLFEPRAPQAFAMAIDRVLQDGELRSRIAAGARRTIEEHNLTWDGNAHRVTELFGILGVKG